LASFSKPASTLGERVASVERRYNPAFCVLVNGSKILLSRLLACQITVGDEIAFRIPTGDSAAPEICITKACSSGTNRCLYQAPVGYVTQPKLDKRQQHFVSAQVEHGNLGISAIFLPCEALREYFYRLPQAEAPAKGHNLYEVLAVSSGAAPAEIRLAFKQARPIPSKWQWNALLTFSGSRNYVLATTPCSAIRTLQRCFPTAASAQFS
jgi:hypothetical protein